MDAFKKQTNNHNAFGVESMTQMRWDVMDSKLDGVELWKMKDWLEFMKNLVFILRWSKILNINSKSDKARKTL